MPQSAPRLSRTEQSRVNGARSRGPVTDDGKARAARNGVRHGLRGRGFGRLPEDDPAAFARLQHAVRHDWRPRDGYEEHWVGELFAAMWRQERLRGLEVELLDAASADPEYAGSEAVVQRLRTFARYGARLDRDFARALDALKILKTRPDDSLAAAALLEPDPSSVARGTPEPEPPEVAVAAAVQEPGAGPHLLPQRPGGDTLGPDATSAPPADAAPVTPPRLNRKERRRLQAIARKTRGA